MICGVPHTIVAKTASCPLLWTTERAPSSAILRARFREVGGSGSGDGGDGGDPTPSPIPLPGAAWLILAALAVVERETQTA